MDQFFSALERLGLPVAVAGLLIWHFLSINRQVTDHNRHLLDELSKLREMLHQAVKDKQDNERLLKQNETLVTVIKSSERASMELVRDLIQGLPNSPNRK